MPGETERVLKEVEREGGRGNAEGTATAGKEEASALQKQSHVT
jgi:hypothetical protein